MSHACGKGIPCTGEAGNKNCYLLQSILPSWPPTVKARLSLRSSARGGSNLRCYSYSRNLLLILVLCSDDVIQFQWH